MTSGWFARRSVSCGSSRITLSTRLRAISMTTGRRCWKPWEKRWFRLVLCLFENFLRMLRWIDAFLQCDLAVFLCAHCVVVFPEKKWILLQSNILLVIYFTDDGYNFYQTDFNRISRLMKRTERCMVFSENEIRPIFNQFSGLKTLNTVFAEINAHPEISALQKHWFFKGGLHITDGFWNVFYCCWKLSAQGLYFGKYGHSKLNY